MYHRFGEDKYQAPIFAADQFDSHLEKLANDNYTVLSLTKIIDTYKGGTDFLITVAITIDDTYLSVFNEAWPRLRARLSFTVFVATDPLDNEHPNYMSWDQLRQLQANGVDIGSQTKEPSSYASD